MKKQKNNQFEFLSEELMFIILDLLQPNSHDLKSFSLSCKWFHALESKHRRVLRPLRADHLHAITARYPSLETLDLTLCPRVSDTSLSVISGAYEETLRRVDLSRSRFFTGNGVLTLAASCRNLVELDLSNATELRDAAAAAVARAGNLRKLWLNRCKLITDMGIGCIAVGCRKLKLISLKWCVGVADLGVELLAIKCKELQTLDLSYLPITEKCLSPIFKLQHLEDLVLEGCFGIDDGSLNNDSFKQGCKTLKLFATFDFTNRYIVLFLIQTGWLKWRKASCVLCDNKIRNDSIKGRVEVAPIMEKMVEIQLRWFGNVRRGLVDSIKLDISGCQNISHIGLSKLTSIAGCVEQLVLADGSPVTHALADSLTKLSMLQSVILDGCQITCDGLKAIGNLCISLRELSLSKCVGVTDEALSFLVSKHKDLRKLDITCCRKITDVSISSIANSCTSLISLKMESCTLVPPEAFIMIGHRCHYLEELDITDNEIDDEGLESISRCSRLSSLKLGICLNITDRGLAYIGMCCSKLKELDLYRSTGITDLGVSAVAFGCPDLEMINTSYCTSITDRALLSLSKCSNLKILEIRGCLLVTSMGLASIAMNCKNLSRLDIKKCYNIDDSGMIQLAHFSQNLRQINLSYSSVTDVGLLSLASISCLQSFTVLHLHGLAPVGLSAALLACGGLTKVKLHVSLRSLLPEMLIRHVEARGCMFEWRDKVFQAELDPKCWKLQLEDLLQ